MIEQAAEIVEAMNSINSKLVVPVNLLSADKQIAVEYATLCPFLR